MQIASDIAAYGLFQIAFAGLDTRMSRCLVKLSRCQDIKLAFGVFRRKTFSHRLKMIRKAAESIVDGEGNPDPNFSEEVRELRVACDLAESVRTWRNERIHAEVRFAGENQPVIVDETGNRLNIDIEACEGKIREAIHAGIVMEAVIPRLVAYKMDLEELSDE
jgi:hypothetical protein